MYWLWQGTKQAKAQSHTTITYQVILEIPAQNLRICVTFPMDSISWWLLSYCLITLAVVVQIFSFLTKYLFSWRLSFVVLVQQLIDAHPNQFFFEKMVVCVVFEPFHNAVVQSVESKLNTVTSNSIPCQNKATDCARNFLCAFECAKNHQYLSKAANQSAAKWQLNNITYECVRDVWQLPVFSMTSLSFCFGCGVRLLVQRGGN